MALHDSSITNGNGDVVEHVGFTPRTATNAYRAVWKDSKGRLWVWNYNYSDYSDADEWTEWTNPVLPQAPIANRSPVSSLVETITVPRGRIVLIRGLGSYVWGTTDHGLHGVAIGEVQGRIGEEAELRVDAILDANDSLRGCRLAGNLVTGLFGG